MSIVKQRVRLDTHFFSVNSPISYALQINDDSQNKIVIAGGQSIQFDVYQLLPKRFVEVPQWKIFIIYEDSDLAEGENVIVNNYNIDLGNNMSAVGGQLVTIDLSALYRKIDSIIGYNKSIYELYKQGQYILPRAEFRNGPDLTTHLFYYVSGADLIGKNFVFELKETCSLVFANYYDEYVKVINNIKGLTAFRFYDTLGDFYVSVVSLKDNGEPLKNGFSFESVLMTNPDTQELGFYCRACYHDMSDHMIGGAVPVVFCGLTED